MRRAQALVLHHWGLHGHWPAEPRGKIMDGIGNVGEPTNKKAAVYASFSTDLQNGRSIDDQVTLCRNYALQEGMNGVEQHRLVRALG